MRLLTPILTVLLFAATAHAALVETPVTYSDGATEMQGFLVYDDAIEGARPGVLVVHEWYGCNDYAKERARMLAALGYTALAVDMYGGGAVADNPEGARELVMQVLPHRDKVISRFNAARTLLGAHETVDAARIGGIGYCFGGAVLLEMARSGADLAGVVSFHGSFVTGAPAERGAVKTRILVCHGASDPMIGPDAVAAFMQEMAEARADLSFLSYPDAMHSFTNPSADSPERGSQYHAEADARSWAAMQAFFEEVLAAKE